MTEDYTKTDEARKVLKPCPFCGHGQPAPKVKPLEWTQEDESENLCWTADAFGLTYEVNVDADGQAYWGFFRSVFSPDTVVSGGLDEAKAAAQADYECRILEALE